MKHVSVLVLAIAGAGLLAIGCHRPDTASTDTDRDTVAAFDLAATRRVVEEKNRRFTEAHVTGDSVAMVDIFTQDARVLPPDSDPVIGRPAIEALTSQYLTFGITEFREETTAFYGGEDLLIDEGTYIMVYGADSTRESGKYLNVWKKEGGEWKVYSNMWNTNGPTTPAGDPVRQQ
jgi:ketosteroid isomerase-like protein